jgi:uncharacterized membrane protein YkvA (DUF1232 family)
METRIDYNLNKMLKELKILYDLLNKILISPRSDWKTKIYANAALSYFINPDDVLPESKLGKKGYIDDFYICLLIVRDLKRYRSKLITELFQTDSIGNVDTFISTRLSYCKEKLGRKTFAVKDTVGYDSLQKLDISNSKINEKVGKLLDTNSKMVGMVAFLYELLLENNLYNDFLKKRLTESELFFDINRIIKEYNSNPITYKLAAKNDVGDIFVNYVKQLENINIDKNNYSDIIKFAHPLFKTLCKIHGSNECDWITKQEINCALSYFGLINDIIPDSIEGGVGFIDDIFLSSFILFDILDRNPKLVQKHLTKDLHIKDILYALDQSSKVIEKQIGEVINLLGLRGLLSYYDLYLKEDKICPVNKLNNKLKRTLIDLLEFYLSNRQKIKGRLSFDEIKEILIDNLDMANRERLNEYIEIAIQLSHNRNIEKALATKEHEEVELLLLKHKILRGDYE